MPTYGERDNRYFQNFLISLKLQLENMDPGPEQLEELEQVERALVKLDHGSFGDCEKCGEEIPYGRLRMAPENPFCPECAPEAAEAELEFELDP